MAEARTTTSQVDGRRKKSKQEQCEMCQEKQSIGYCSQCEMYICQSCFELHRRSRACTSHVLLDAPDSSETSDHYESCTKHDHQPIKFYCSGHKFLGCGECILAGHKMCKYEHISEASRRFQENGQLAWFLEEIQSLESNHKECIDNIDEQTEATSSMEQSAEDDIESFTELLITYVTKAKKIALDEVKSKGLTSKQQIDKLKDDVEAIGSPLDEVTAAFRNVDRVNKLFILAVESKPKVASIRNALSTIDRNVITEFSFQPSKILKEFASNTRPLGIFTDISQEKKDPNFRFTTRQTSEKCVDQRDIIQDDLMKLTSIQDKRTKQEEDIDQLKDENRQLKDKSTKQEEDIDQLKDEKRQLKDKSTKQEEDIDQLKDEKRQLKDKGTKQEEDIDQLKDENRQLKDKSTKQEEDIDQLKDKKRQLKDKSTKQEEDIDQLKDEKRQLKDKSTKQEEDIDQLKDEKRQLKATVQRKPWWSSPFQSFSSFLSPKKKVQIMNPTLTRTTNEFTSAMVTNMNDYEWMVLENNLYNKQIPLIVVCPNSRRLVPDVDLALETIEIVIIHTGSEANLPAIPSCKKMENYKEVAFIDMGFEQHKGIYKCAYNIEAFKKLKQYIKRFYDAAGKH